MRNYGWIILGAVSVFQMQTASAGKNPLPKPKPVIEWIDYPHSIIIGDTAEIGLKVRNDGGDSDEGGVSVSFPSLKNTNDCIYVEDNGSSSDLNFSCHAKGDSIWYLTDHKIAADYLLAEGVDFDWKGSETNYFKIKVKPQQVGDFVIQYRSTMGQDGWSQFGTTPTSDPKDQQGWWVYKKTIEVTEDKEITVKYPSSSSAYQIGFTYRIEWDWKGPIDNVEIYLLRDGNYVEDITAGTTCNGNYSWSIPNLTPDDNYQIYIEDDANADINDYSDYFAIMRHIEVTFPNDSNDTLYIADTNEIRWITSGLDGNVRIDYSTDGGFNYHTAINPTPDDGSFDWHIQETIAPTTQGKIWIRHQTYTSNYDKSDVNFKFAYAVEEVSSKPKTFSLAQNSPNPVISGTHIEYALPKTTQITIKVYDITGKPISTLITENQKPGKYAVCWNGTDNGGKRVATGIYFYRLEANEFKATRKLTIIR